MDISIIIPVFNEEKTVIDLLKINKQAEITLEIILSMMSIDDKVINKQQDLLLNLEENLGKGGAVLKVERILFYFKMQI